MSYIVSPLAAAIAKSIAEKWVMRMRILGYVNSSSHTKSMMERNNLVQDGPWCWISTGHGSIFWGGIWRPKPGMPPPDITTPKAACKLVNVYYPAKFDETATIQGKVWSCKFSCFT